MINVSNSVTCITLKDQPCMAILTPFDLNPDDTTRHYVTINLWLT